VVPEKAVRSTVVASINKHDLVYFVSPTSKSVYFYEESQAIKCNFS